MYPYVMRLIALVCLALLLCAAAAQVDLEWQDCSMEGKAKVKSVTLLAPEPYRPFDAYFSLEAEIGALDAF